MIGQTLAIFLDAYRELNSKRMFWVVLVLSGLLVLAFAAAGIDANGDLTLLGFRTPIPIFMSPADFYKLLFVTFGVEVWLAFAATILAIISTASIFPDFLSGGSIDLYLAKPINRLRLFLTKYAAGILFVGLQVSVFCVASFVLIGLRGGAWEPRILLGIPIVVCFFSYLYCVSVLFGVLTRSTVAAVLLTLLVWGLVFVVHASEIGLLTFQFAADREVSSARAALPTIEQQIATAEKYPEAERPFGWEETLKENQRKRDELYATMDSPARRNLEIGHRIVYALKTALPKTSETTALLSRALLFDQATDEADEPPPPPRKGRRREGPVTEADRRRIEREVQSRSVAWIVGTSLIFEGVVLGWAAWVFCRRDY